MKVLIAVHHFLPSYHGGAEWRAYRTAKELQRRGIEVRLLTVESISSPGRNDSGYTDTEYDGLPVRRLFYDLAASPHPFIWSYRNPITGQQTRQLLAEFEPDVMHLIGGYLLSGSVVEAAQASQVPVVLTLTDFWFMCPHVTMMHSDGSLCPFSDDPHECVRCLLSARWPHRSSSRAAGSLVRRGSALLQRLYAHLPITTPLEMSALIQGRRRYLQHILTQTAAVISPSCFLKRFFEERGYRPEPFLYIRQGLEVNHWAPAVWQPDARRLRIGYIGQIAPHKGVSLLIEAFRRLRVGTRKPELWLYGDVKRDPQFMRRICRTLDGRHDVIFAGTFANRQVRMVHAGLDVLVVPSIWYENSPTVILEAFASGTPVIVSNLGGMAELVRHEIDGLLFNPGDVNALAQQLQRAIDDEALLFRLRQGVPPIKTIEEEIDELCGIYCAVQRRRESVIAPRDSHLLPICQPTPNALTDDAETRS